MVMLFQERTMFTVRITVEMELYCHPCCRILHIETKFYLFSRFNYWQSKLRKLPVAIVRTWTCDKKGGAIVKHYL